MNVDVSKRTIWIAPDLIPPAPIDAIIFDVDGVLWHTGGSYDEAARRTVQFILQTDYGVDAPVPVTDNELRQFRMAGGFNNDWDLSYAAIAVRLAGYADPSAVAAESGGHGRQWADSILPPGVKLDWERVRWVFDEIYWGEEMFRRLFHRPPETIRGAPGTWHREERLLPLDLLGRLRQMGVRHFGIATGRNRNELTTVFERSDLSQEIPATAIVTADELAKPDGRVLKMVLAGFAGTDATPGSPPRAALFCGDTRDDLLAVLNYRKLTAQESARTWIGAVAVIPEEQDAFYQQAGSDAGIRHVAQLPALVEVLNARVQRGV